MEYFVRTTKEQEFVNITSLVNKAVSESGVKDGIAMVFVPHTTAGVTINEKYYLANTWHMKKVVRLNL
jgi:secondary thiamine-phosphate synthase enzyme